MRENSSLYQYQSKEPIATIQAVDYNGDPLGERVKIYGSAVITNSGRKIEVMGRRGRSFYASEVAAVEGEEVKSIPGIYGNIEDAIRIVPVKGGVYIFYEGFPTLLHWFREKGERRLKPMDLAGVIVKWGEGIDILMRGTYGEVGRKDDLPVVGRGAYLRIEALPRGKLKELEKKLYQQ